MKIYLAGSFAHKAYIRDLGKRIRAFGHDVYVFCDYHTDAFQCSTALRKSGVHKELNPCSALNNELVRMIGNANWEELKQCDCVIVTLPSGKSAHLEAGWAKGQGKKVFVFGELQQGDFDAMYVMLDGVYNADELVAMMHDIEK